jgi:hypothetical protein
MTEYFAVMGSRLSDKDAAKVGPVLDELLPADAPTIVRAAEPEDSVLHPYFEWSDPIAAEEFRLVQARDLASSIEVKVTRPDGEETRVRAFHAVRWLNGDAEPERFRHYVPIRVVQGDQEMANDVVEEARRALAAWRRKYEAYRHLFPPELQTVLDTSG